MSILNTLSKIGAIAALAVSVVAFPAVAQHHGGGFKSGFKNHKGGKFSNRRGGFRGHRGNSFRGGRGFNRGHSGFSNRGFRGNRGFSSKRNFNRGFSNRGFNRGHSGFNNGGFNRGHSGFNSRRNFNRSFRGQSGFRGHNNFNGHNGGFKKQVIHSPVHKVGGFYGNHSNTVFISDFATHGLYAPPRGYHWVCDKGSKDAILAAVATGAIIAVAANILATPY